MDYKNSNENGLNSGVHCEVRNCVYNNQQNGCNASVIDVVGPDQAQSESETNCQTFRSNY